MCVAVVGCTKATALIHQKEQRNDSTAEVSLLG
jgi:hypothetical protein